MQGFNFESFNKLMKKKNLVMEKKKEDATSIYHMTNEMKEKGEL